MFSKTEIDARFEAFRIKHSCLELTILVAASPGGHRGGAGSSGVSGHAPLSPAAIKLSRGILTQIQACTEIDLDLDHQALLAIFARPSDAVKFSLALQASLRAMAEESAHMAFDRIGIHGWSIQGADVPTALPQAHTFISELNLCVALSQIAAPHQVLLTPWAFETARGILKKEDFGKMAPAHWLAHGPYDLAALGLQTELFEVGETGASSLTAPSDSEGVRRTATEEDPLAWGWRPGPGASVPGTRCILESRLPDSRFGEVWAAVDTMVKEKKMFKFCFRKDWAHALKEAEPALLLVKKKLSQNRNVLAIQGTSLDQPPYFVQCELFEGKDLHAWCHERGGVGAVQFSSRLELVAQAASGLQAAHEAKVLHQDIRPENILVFGTGESARHVQVKVTDFQTSHIGLQTTHVEEALESEPPSTTVATKPGAVPEGSTEAAAAMPGDPYLAPELLEGKPPSPNTDIYALGVVLAQLVLGRFTNALLPERLKEVLSVVKRPALLAVVAEKPEERADSASLFVGELRNAVKERDSRMHAHQAITPRVLARNIALGTLAVIAAVLLLQEVPKWFHRDTKSKPNPAESTKAASRPTEIRISRGDPSDLALKDTPNESEAGNTVVQVGGEHQAAAGSKAPAKANESTSLDSGAVKFLVLPMIAVLALFYGIPRILHLIRHKKA